MWVARPSVGLVCHRVHAISDRRETRQQVKGGRVIAMPPARKHNDRE